MANTQAIANSFKVESMNGIHAMGTTVVRAGTGADVWKAALYLATATMDSTATVYTVTNEVTGTGYTAGGVTFTWVAPSNTTTIAFTTPSASFSWTTATMGPFDACLLYNSTQGNKAMGVYTFGSQTITAGNFSLTMPTNNSTTGLFRIS
jgi:hypothetical protein